MICVPINVTYAPIEDQKRPHFSQLLSISPLLVSLFSAMACTRICESLLLLL
eukprot:XP_001706824.1 Hypothetical protein GL50803_39594 [Giardia lamblia ATCC 50803]